MKTTIRWASALLLLSGCGDPGVLSSPAAPRVQRAVAPACGAGDCVLKSSGVFAGEPGAGLAFADFPVQQAANRGGAVLQDILSHLPARYGNTYSDDDPLTHGHETSHGIHSHIRNTMNDTGGRANGFYVLQNRAVIVPEPGIRKSAAGPFIPQSLRGSRYATYITGQQAWDDTPLYIWDEWNAYVNGGAAGVDLVNGGQWNRGWRDGVAGVLEFTVYAIAVAMAVEEGDPQYFQENRQFREFLAWNTRRAMEVFRAGKDLEAFRWDRQDAYYEALRTAPDAEAFRAFCRRFFGPAWADAVLFGRAPSPPSSARTSPSSPTRPSSPTSPSSPLPIEHSPARLGRSAHQRPAGWWPAPRCRDRHRRRQHLRRRRPVQRDAGRRRRLAGGRLDGLRAWPDPRPRPPRPRRPGRGRGRRRRRGRPLQRHRAGPAGLAQRRGGRAAPRVSSATRRPSWDPTPTSMVSPTTMIGAAGRPRRAHLAGGEWMGCAEGQRRDG
ncbi:MAG: hypothetical protein R3F43_32005 [bacterium]